MPFEPIEQQSGVSLVCGVDEAGRGPLAGAVYAAAVILAPDFDLPGLNDSKKLTEKKRESLFDQITAQALSYCIASVDAQKIDEINILQATFLAMRQAVDGLSPGAELALVDGNLDPRLGIPTQTFVKGDSRCASIAAASILAKVARDRYMLALDAEYPQYCFAQHKGYGTKLHYEQLAAHGISPVHRRSFLKKFVVGVS